MKARLAARVLAVVLVASQCKFADDPTGVGGTTPIPGSATVGLATPNADDGAVLLTLTGPSLPTFTPSDPDFRVFSRQAGPGELRVIVLGDLRNGALLTFPVPDINRLGEYRATIVSVASRDDQLRASLGGYGTNIVGAEATAAR